MTCKDQPALIDGTYVWLCVSRRVTSSVTMKPNNANGRLPSYERPSRMLILADSDRRQHNCPGVDSKARTLMLRDSDRADRDR